MNEERASIDVANSFPIAAWQDEPVRPHLWQLLRDRASEVARRERGWVLSDDAEDRRTPMFGRYLEDSEGNLVLWPCPEEDAEMVTLHMRVWSVPNGQR